MTRVRIETFDERGLPNGFREFTGGPPCPDCFGNQTELLPGRVVYECHECGRAFQQADSDYARRRL